MRSLLLLLSALLLLPSVSWAGAYVKGGGGSTWTDYTLDPQEISGQNCGPNGCTRPGGLTWIPLDPFIVSLGRDDDSSVIGNSGDTLKRECSTTATGFLPHEPAIGQWTATTGGGNYAEFSAGAELSWCRDSTGVTDDAQCGTGAALVYKACSSGASCSPVVSASHPDMMACRDVSTDIIHVLPITGYNGCNSATEQAVYQSVERWTTAAGDECQKLLADGIHPTHNGALWFAQRWLESYWPEVIKNNLWTWGDGETHSGVAATTKWTFNCGSGGTGCSILATSWNSNNYGYTSAYAIAGAGVELNGTAAGPNAYIQYSEPAGVSQGIYQWSCAVHGATSTTQDIRINLISDLGTVAASNRSDAIDQSGYIETGYDWTVSNYYGDTRGYYRLAMGLVKITTESTLTIRIEDADPGAPSAKEIFVDECGLERAPVQSMDWADQHRVPGGTYDVQAIGDSRMATAGGATRFPWAVMWMQADSRITSPRSTAFRSDITIVNDVRTDAWTLGGSLLADYVGPLRSDCTTAPLNGVLSTLKGTSGVVAFHYDINDFRAGLTVLPNTANPGCLDWTDQVGYAESLSSRQEHAPVVTMFGPMPYLADVTSGDLCNTPSGSAENCGKVAKDATINMLHGQVGQ